MHPLAFPGNKSRVIGLMVSGDKAVHIPTGKTCIIDEFLPDGDAFITFDGGAWDTVKWNELRPLDKVCEDDSG